MGASERKAGTAVADGQSSNGSEGSAAAPRRARSVKPPGAVSRRSGGASPLRVFKPGQGAYVRWGTAIGTAVIAGGAVYFVNDQLALLNVKPQTLLIVRVIVAAALVAVGAWLVFWLIGRNHGVVDFMIATEGEMKKVNWSSRKEVFGATRVVIVMVLALAFFLFAVNLLFIALFSWIDVLKIPIFESMFGGRESGA
jgi:preprotein translocase SecE subunit